MWCMIQINNVFAIKICNLICASKNCYHMSIVGMLEATGGCINLRTGRAASLKLSVPLVFTDTLHVWVGGSSSRSW